ncbi:MAG: GHKL domain-containing protein [Eubacterium sp.]|nr:GHKL domain-containing protein [Eubacterium sp.]
MTCIDKFYSVLSVYFFSSISYIGEVLCILSAIFIMLCFLGAEGNVTLRTFVPGFIYTGIVIAVNALCVIHDFVVLRPMWNEVFKEGTVRLSVETDFKMFFTILTMVLIIISSIVTFTKKRALNVAISLVMIVLFETYISCEMLYTAMYFSDEPKNYILKFNGIDGYLGTGFSNIFVISYSAIMLIIFMMLYFGLIRKQRVMYIGWKNRIFFILWEVLMICIMYVPVMGGISGIEQVKYIEYEMGIIMFLMGIAVPILMITLIARRYASEKKLIQEEYIAAELDYINQYKKNQLETRAFRHDIINNLSLLSAMHKDKKFDEIKDYINTLMSSISAMSVRYITGDEMLNCIIGMKSSKMDEEQIDFSTEGIIEGGLGMRPVDVCNVFSNAMDNAIEACEKLEKGKDRWIRLSLIKADDFYKIELKNPMPQPGRNSNKDMNLHGYGMHNMKETIGRYGGKGMVEEKEGMFTFSITIPADSL